jgi:hypothetical protein
VASAPKRFTAPNALHHLRQLTVQQSLVIFITTSTQESRMAPSDAAQLILFLRSP